MKKTGKTAALALTMSMAVTAMPFGVSAEETDKTVVRINMESEQITWIHGFQQQATQRPYFTMYLRDLYCLMRQEH